MKEHVKAGNKKQYQNNKTDLKGLLTNSLEGSSGGGLREIICTKENQNDAQRA